MSRFIEGITVLASKRFFHRNCRFWGRGSYAGYLMNPAMTILIRLMTDPAMNMAL